MSEAALPPFSLLFERHGRDVYRFLVAAVGRDDADDCFQETFLSALRAYPRLRDGSNLRGWLLTIAGRKAIDAHRGRARRPVPTDELDPRDGAEPAEPPDRDLWRRVRELPEETRLAVLHRFVNDLAYADIARLLGCSEAAARQRVRFGLGKLREVMVP
jgi:RNA polymerase sigma factor (sigma-70 family)